MPALNQTEVGKKLGALPGWTLKGGRIEKSYELGSFPAALEFMQQAAALAEAEQERPPARRADEVEEDADRRRLARAVGPEESEHLALADLEIQLVDAAGLPVALGQSLGSDDRLGHAVHLRRLIVEVAERASQSRRSRSYPAGWQRPDTSRDDFEFARRAVTRW